MAPLTDPDRKKHYFKALEQSKTTVGYVVLKPTDIRRLRLEMSKFDLTFEGLCQEMWEDKNRVSEVVETRSDYEYPFHYDFVLSVNGQKVYVETVLDMELNPEDSTIVIVNIHEAN